MQNEKCSLQVHSINTNKSPSKKNYTGISEDKWKSGITNTHNYSETSIVKMKHHSVGLFGKLSTLDKYQH